jgi:hypothetical protein
LTFSTRIDYFGFSKPSGNPFLFGDFRFEAEVKQGLTLLTNCAYLSAVLAVMDRLDVEVLNRDRCVTVETFIFQGCTFAGMN